MVSININEIPKYVKLGTNVTIQENVVLGLGKEELGDLIIGDNSTIRSGTVIYRGTKIGSYFNSGHNALIRERNVIGDRVVVGTCAELAPGNKLGNYINIHGHCFLEDAVIGDYTFLAPGVVCLDDMFPIEPNEKEWIGAHIGHDTAIGGNSTLRPGVKIGNNVLIGSGSVVTKDISDGQLWAGNPAKYMRNIEGLFRNGKQYVPGTRTRYIGLGLGGL